MTTTELRSLLKRLNTASTRFVFRSQKSADEDGPGYVIERRRKIAGQWHFVGWSEDIKTPKEGVFTCYGESII